MRYMNFTVIYVVDAVIGFLTVSGLDIENAMLNENRPCFVPKETIPVNVTWVTSVNTWYYPHMSKLDLYLQTLQLLGREKFVKLTEANLYSDACIKYQVRKRLTGNWYVHGFEDTTVNFKLEAMNRSGIYNWSLEEEKLDNQGVGYVTLTDNETFQFLTTCQQKRMTWKVISTLPTLPPETDNEIYRHAQNKGFNPDQFTGLWYDRCAFGDVKNKIDKIAGAGAIHRDIELWK